MTNETMCGLFALTRDEDDEVAALKVLLDVPTLDEIRDVFAAQLVRFPSLDASAIPYQPLWQPEPGEVIRVQEFRVPTAVKNCICAPDAIPVLTDTSLRDVDIKGLALVEYAPTVAKGVVTFQLFTSAQLLAHSRLHILMRKETFTRLAEPGLTIGQSVCAVLKEGHLYFRSERAVRRFLDLDYLYAPASEQELRGFAEHETFAPDQAGILMAFVDEWVRQKVSLILRSKILENVNMGRLERASKKYGIALKIVEAGSRRCLELPGDKAALKKVLRLLNQDYLDCSITTRSFQVGPKRQIS